MINVNKNRLLIICSVVLMIWITFFVVKDIYKDKLLKNSIQTYAIYYKHIPGSGKMSPSGKFWYFINNEKKEFTESGRFEMLSYGDTVLIEYSVEDNNVARVVDKYYMRKYKNFK